LPFDWRGNNLDLRGFKAGAAKIVLPAGKQRVSLDGVSLSGRGRLDFAARSAIVDSLTVEAPRLGRLEFSGQAAASAKPTVALDARGQNLDLASLIKYFSALVPAEVSAWQPVGQADLSVSVRSGPQTGGRYSLTGSLNLSKAGFQDATGTIVSEGLEPRLKVEADVLTSSAPVPFSLALELANGESLWKDAYFNWRNDPLKLELRAEFNSTTGTVSGGDASVFFAPLGELKARGSASLGPAPRLDLHVAAPSLDLARLYAFLGKMRPSQASTLDVHGSAEATADIRFAKLLSFRGLVKVRGGTVKEKDGSLVLAGIDADLPLSMSIGARPGEDVPDYSLSPGFFQIKEVKSPAANLSSLRLDFLAARNLFLLYPVGIRIWGSNLALGRTVLSLAPAGLALRGVSTLAMSDLDFSRLPFNSESFKLVGTASIPEAGLLVSPKEVRFGGRMLATLFGGRMTLDRLRVTDAFSAGRRIMFDAEVEGLDLGKLTDSVPFGEVTGIVDVSLQGLALSYGQPESFAMTIRSAPTKGVPQKFSLKAVDNLSVISSGGKSSAPSSSLLTKFVHSFNYSRIGIACSLRNDVFTLKGTIVEGGVQYLVRRATFFGIDVVNAKPVNTISFKDMMGRLERVGQSQEKK
jgi:hypothetical protein